MQRVAPLVLICSLSKKKSGTPISTAGEKQTSCLFVKLRKTFVFTLERSFGTVTYAIVHLLSGR